MMRSRCSAQQGPKLTSVTISPTNSPRMPTYTEKGDVQSQPKVNPKLKLSLTLPIVVSKTKIYSVVCCYVISSIKLANSMNIFCGLVRLPGIPENEDKFLLPFRMIIKSLLQTCKNVWPTSPRVVEIFLGLWNFFSAKSPILSTIINANLY